MRFLDLLVQNVINLKFKDIKIRVPHPGAFGLHKLIVSGRRKNEEKMLKDRQEALLVLNALIKNNESDKIKIIFDKMLVAWRRKVLNSLKKHHDNNIVHLTEK